MASRPGDVLVLAQPQEQLELLREQEVVVREVVAEERERLDERAAPDHDLGPPARDEVNGRELLEHADGIVGREHGHGAGQADALRLRRRRGQHDCRSRDGEVGPVVLADAEHVEADLLRELDLLEEVSQALCRGDAAADVREGEDADLHGGFYRSRVSAGRVARPP